MPYTQTTRNMEKPSKITVAKIQKAVEKIKQELKQGGDMEALNIAYRKDDLPDIQNFADFINKNFKHVVVMGIGGSSLGAKTLCSLKDDHHITILESIDSNTVRRTFEKLDLPNTAFLTVSKSGKTIECISQTLIALKIVEDKFGKDYIKKHFFFLTEDKDSPLTNLAKEFGIKTMPHHKSVGGRFSYLSNVGLIPAAIAGLDIEKIRDSAANTIDLVLNNPENNISEICGQKLELFDKGIIASVMMPYVDKLKYLTEWYRQLWSESLGKNGKGTIPIDAMGTTDQHSQLQLYMDGPKNKFYTFILKDKDPHALKITKSYNEGFKHLEGKTLDDIMDIEAKSTIEVLAKRGLPMRIWNLKKLDEEVLSKLLMQKMLETIIIGNASDTNPFGQSAVEERKILARKWMEEK